MDITGEKKLNGNSYYQRGSFRFCKIHMREQAVAFHEEMEVELAFEFQKWIRGYFRQSGWL